MNFLLYFSNLASSLLSCRCCLIRAFLVLSRLRSSAFRSFPAAFAASRESSIAHFATLAESRCAARIWERVIGFATARESVERESDTDAAASESAYTLAESVRETLSAISGKPDMSTESGSTASSSNCRASLWGKESGLLLLIALLDAMAELMPSIYPLKYMAVWRKRGRGRDWYESLSEILKVIRVMSSLQTGLRLSLQSNPFRYCSSLGNWATGYASFFGES